MASLEEENLGTEGMIEVKDKDSVDHKTEMLPVEAGKVITESMIEEEEKMEQTSKEAEKEIFEDMKQKEERVTKEMCYKRLEHLLNRSNFYTQFLLKRMKEQQVQKDNCKHSRVKEKPVLNTEPRKSTRQSKRKCKTNISDGADVNNENEKPNENLIVAKGTQSRPANKNVIQQRLETGNRKKRKQPSPTSAKQLNIEDYYTEENLAKRQKVQEEEGVLDQDAVDTFSRVINNEKVSDRQPELFSGGIMRDYQLDGYEWLKLLYENGVNGILGDEMGLGKTIQCIALIAHLVEMGVTGPFMVCAPLSTLPNWIMEFERFAPKIPVVLYHGNPQQREEIFRKLHKTVEVDGKATKPTVITSYEMAMHDRNQLQQFEWRYLIIDEGHRIKNFNCRLIRELKRLNTANRLLLTGTPLQNNLSELWSLLNFLLPEIFDDLAVFQSWFDVTMLCDDGYDDKIIEQEKEKQIIAKLHQILTPFLLRRVKTDVALNIPPKREMLVYAPLATLQQTYYEATLDRSIHSLLNPPKEERSVVLNDKGRPERRCSRNVDFKKLLDVDVDDDINDIAPTLVPPMTPSFASSHENIEPPKMSEQSLNLRNTCMQLRKACNHPYLIDYPLNPVTHQYLVDEQIVKCCGKMQVLDLMLARLKKSGHKVLLFSQMTKMLDILEDFCYFRKYTFCRLDGSMKIEDRQEQIRTFNNDPDTFIFLLSTRAGGLGINLAAADTVIIYDSDWNPQCDLQAQDRCHRIGQDKPVVVYRFVTAGTVDEKIVDRAAAKRKLEKMIIHKGKFKSGKANMRSSLSAINPTELVEMLKLTEWRVVRASGNIYTEAELNLLLDRSDLVQRMQGNANLNHSFTSKLDEVSDLFKIVSNECLAEIEI